MNSDDYIVISEFLNMNVNISNAVLELFKQSHKIYNVKLFKNEIFILQEYYIHVVKTLNTDNYIYRAEIDHIEENIYDFTYAASYKFKSNNDFFQLMKYKLIIFKELKTLFILDIYGFKCSNRTPQGILKIYSFKSILNNNEDSKYIKLVNLSLQRLMPNFTIYYYKDLYYAEIYNIVYNIFKYIINYPSALENFLDVSIVTKINNYNYSYKSSQINNMAFLYDMYILDLIKRCNNLINIDYNTLSIWFGYG